MICMQLQLSELLEGPRDIFRRFSGGLGFVCWTASHALGFVGQLRQGTDQHPNSELQIILWLLSGEDDVLDGRLAAEPSHLLDPLQPVGISAGSRQLLGFGTAGGPARGPRAAALGGTPGLLSGLRFFS